jgi:hypothetical protein
MKSSPFTVSPWAWHLSRGLEIAIWLGLAAKFILTVLWIRPPHAPVRPLLDDSISFLFLAITIFIAANLWLSVADWRRGVFALARALFYFLLFTFTGLPLDCAGTERPNQTMEQTASGRYNLPFSGLSPYPVAMIPLARGSSSWSR